MNHFTLLVTSTLHPHPAVSICTAGACSPSVADNPGAVGFIRDRNGAQPGISLSAMHSDEWTVAMFKDQEPSALTVQVGPATHPYATRTFELSWHRADLSDSCHNWQTVATKHFALP